MDPKPRRPQHASYRRHRSQVAWQIILPIIVAGLLLIVATYFITISTFRDNGDVGRWAAISTIWLTIPVLFEGLIWLALFIGLAWAVGKAAGFIPPYSHKAQVIATEVEARVKQGVVYAYRPARILPQIGRLVRSGIRKALHR